ncbi:MAG: ParB N-terminal domain-containing protein [Candidatus Bathyarchaeota archaeon]|nr:MAG: ParB N-terminal domain-containing protein [Candidatus Bathyarchaeota archaeon]
MIKLKRLKVHEEVDTLHLKNLKEEINSDGILKFAIAVDQVTNIILDGLHRFNALKELGCKEIPAVFVNYDSPHIKVKSWRDGWEITKDMVRTAGLTRRKLPSKTSKHLIRANGRLVHIFAIEKEVNFSLEELRRQ